MQVVIDRNQDSESWLRTCGCRMWSKEWRWQGRVKDEARSTSKADEHRRYHHMIIHHGHVVLEPPRTYRTYLGSPCRLSSHKLHMNQQCETVRRRGKRLQQPEVSAEVVMQKDGSQEKVASQTEKSMMRGTWKTRGCEKT